MPLSDEQIAQGVDSIVATRTSPIKGLENEVWTYFLKFTAHFEGVPNHIYSNKDLPHVVGPDVTVGVGISLPTRDSCDAVYNELTFFVKGSGFSQRASLEDVKKDFDTAAGMSRASHSLDDFGRAMLTEIRPMEALQKLPDKVGQLVPGRINKFRTAEFKDFNLWPAQVRVAVASYCYGISPDWGERANKMRAALSVLDFDAAGRLSYVAGWSKLKILAHRKLFWNGGRIQDQARLVNPPPDPLQFNLPPDLRKFPTFSTVKPIQPQLSLPPLTLGLGNGFNRLPTAFNGSIEIEPLVTIKDPPLIRPDWERSD
jgi:hypothetical protein